MTDVVSRLRVMSFMICGEAADLIEAQAERIRVLRDALEKTGRIMGPVVPSCCGCNHEWRMALETIHAALEATK